MPVGLVNIEFLNQNADRRYPLAYDASAQDTTGTFTIPNDFLVEFSLAVDASWAVTPSKFFVYQLGAFATGYSIVIGYSGDAGTVIVASALIARPTFSRGQVYSLIGNSQFPTAVGKLTIWSLDSIDLQPPGIWTFDLTGARLDPDSIRPMLSGVTSLLTVNGSTVSAPYTGVIELVAGTNISLVPSTVGGVTTIQINAIDGAGLTEECGCAGEPAVPITRINGVGPTAAGDFTLLGDNCLQITSIKNGLQITDLCSKPCCGCVELAAITQDLAQFGSEATSLSTFVNQLSVSVNQMNMVVLGSRLADTGCTIC